MPFDEDEEEPVQKKSGVKITNKDSSKSQKPSQEAFQKKANEINNKLNSYSDRAVELTANFAILLEDKTLSENKNIFALDLEKEILGNLIKLGVDINLDSTQDEGMGSIGLITLCFRSILKQRDRINNLEYSLLLLNNKVKDLSAQLDKSKKDG